MNVVIPAALALLAVLVRLVHDLAMSRTPFFTHPGLDAAWHDEWARHIVAGDASRDPYFRAPGYVYFLSLVYRLAGAGPWPIHVVQAFLGGVTTWLVYRLARRLYGRPAGWLAAGTAALYGPLVYFDGELLVPTLAIPIFLLALYLSLRARDSKGWLLAGLAFGAGAVTLPNILAFAILLTLAGVVTGISRREPGILLRQSVPIATGVLVAILPVVIRNGLVGGDWGAGIATQGGVNFYAGNNPKATGVSVVLPEFRRQPGWREFITETNRWAEKEAGHTLEASEVSRLYTKRGLLFWTGAPGEALKLLGWKTYYLLNGHEIPNNRDLYSDRKFSPVLAALLWHLGTFHFPLGLLLPLAVLGILMRRPPGAQVLLVYLIVYAATVALFFVTERYRLPLVPVLIVFAAGAVTGLRRGIRPTVPAVALAALALVVANTHLGHAGEANATQETMRLADARFESGDYGRSAEILEDLARKSPRSPEVYDRLGAARLAQGDKAKAFAAYNEAARRESLEPVMWFNRSALQVEIGRLDDAAASLEKAVLLNPAYADAWINLGIVRSTQGRTDAALEAIDKGLALSPGSATGLAEKGRLLLARGDRAGARAAWNAALRVSPKAPEVRMNLALLDYEEGNLGNAESALRIVSAEVPAFAVVAHFHLARIAARRGDRATLLDELSRARAGGFTGLSQALNDPVFDSFRSDPAFPKIAN